MLPPYLILENVTIKFGKFKLVYLSHPYVRMGQINNLLDMSKGGRIDNITSVQCPVRLYKCTESSFKAVLT